jgi:hypothetical protein
VIQRDNNMSFVLAVLGMVMQVVGYVMVRSQPEFTHLGVLLGISGTILLLVGFAYYAMAKGRNPAWCVMAFLSCLGLIVLACLKDKSASS